jgi:multidrug transporter EmrE-like cation transporter
MMSWLYLCVAGILEVLGVILLKRAARRRDGSERGEGPCRICSPLLLSLIAAMAGSIYLLSLSVRTIPVGTAYAVWTGIGSVGSVAAGILLFDEAYDKRKLLYLAAIVLGMIGLRLTS